MSNDGGRVPTWNERGGEDDDVIRNRIRSISNFSDIDSEDTSLSCSVCRWFVVMPWSLLFFLVFCNNGCLANVAMTIYRHYLYAGLVGLPLAIMIAINLDLVNLALGDIITQVFNPEEPRRIHIVKESDTYYLITGYSDQLLVTVSLVAGLTAANADDIFSSVPDIPLRGNILRVTLNPCYFRLSDLDPETTEIFMINEPVDFIRRFRHVREQLDVFEMTRRPQQERPPLVAGCLYHVRGRDDRILVTVLTKAFGPANMQCFLGRPVVCGNQLQDPLNVATTVCYPLDAVVGGQRQRDESLLQFVDEQENQILPFNRHQMRHIIHTSHLTHIITASRQMFNALSEMELPGRRSSVARMETDLILQGISIQEEADGQSLS